MVTKLTIHHQLFGGRYFDLSKLNPVNGLKELMIEEIKDHQLCSEYSAHSLNT